MRLALLHGNAGSSADWNEVVANPALKDFQCLTPVLWDYFRETRRHGLEDWADWFCDGLGASSKTLIAGYSLGGRLALHALLARPRLFAGAVIVSAHTGLADSRAREERLAADRTWSDLAASDWAGFLEKWERQPVFSGSAKLQDRGALSTWRVEISASFDAWSLGRQENLLPRLNEIHCPVLWVSGRRDDRFTQLARRAALAADGEHVIVESAGHRVPADCPSGLAAVIRDFVQDHL